MYKLGHTLLKAVYFRAWAGAAAPNKTVWEKNTDPLGVWLEQRRMFNTWKTSAPALSLRRSDRDELIGTSPAKLRIPVTAAQKLPTQGCK